MIKNIEKGWSVLQDVHEYGEKFGIFKTDFNPTRFGGDPSIQPMPPWKPVRRLEHLQLTFSSNPYYGFGLRQFNIAPWWYKNEFTVEEDFPYAVLTFQGVDYFADVWLNETYLGSHEGYNTPFEFEVGDILKKGGKNLLVIKVRAPWENETLPNLEYIRFCTVIRDQMKGTYEHSDTFIPRDVNPIGIWNKVLLTTYDGVRLAETPLIRTALDKTYQKADVSLTYLLVNSSGTKSVDCSIKITRYDDYTIVSACEKSLSLDDGIHPVTQSLSIENPFLWTVWERGEANRYTVTIQIRKDGKLLFSDMRHFGIRDIKLVRTADEVTFYLNGERIYLRGTTYFPDAYLSNLNENRYRYDIENALAAGMNSLRIHVHAEKDEFYEMCDEKGILLIQDSDFNWVHPASEEWGKRAVKMVEEMLIRLRNHPSIFCWVLLNEPRGENYLHVSPGPQMIQSIERLDQGRPFILSSWDRNDLQSGDSHNYMGSLDGSHTHYSDIYGTKEKFNTEFGMDAPPCFYTLRKEPEICEILSKVVDGIDEIQYYQYRYIKYFIEHYRMQKFAPCSGHYQFLFTDIAPTSFFGVYDHSGLPKYAHRAFAESNQPVGIFMETKKHEPTAVWVVNDLLRRMEDAEATWQIVSDEMLILKGSRTINIESNEIIEVEKLDFAPDFDKEYKVVLTLRDRSGKMLAKNGYEKAFNPPEHTKGHPDYVDHCIGLRTYWEWMD